MVRSVRLRPWQKRALDHLAESASSDFLAVATPGAGKTTFALTAAVHDLASVAGRRLIVCAPTSHLKVQWADAAARFGLHLDPAWSPAGGRLPADVHGVVTTYQQVASSSQQIRELASGALVVLDEIHHASDDRAWGDAVRHAFEVAARRLCLSGTPFRSDTRAIPFVNYHLDEAVPDYEYGYGDALGDGRVVRPVYFPRINGFMEWVAPDGTMNAASFDDALDRTRSAQRLRTALSLDGEWLSAVLVQADQQLRALRREQPNAGGLIIAADQEHAHGIAELLARRCGGRPTVVVSDDPMSSSRISRFAAGTEPWIVAVRMISEGVDIPRLRIGVYATTTTTELFFRQAVGRLVRWTPGVPRQRAYLFIPDDPRLRLWAAQIAEQRRHSLARVQRDEEFPGNGTELDDAAQPDDAQLSLFAALTAVVMGEHEVSSVFEGDDAFSVYALPDGSNGSVGDEGIEFALPALPHSLSTGGDGGDGGSEPVIDLRAQRSRLRDENSALVQELVRFTAMSHAAVNGRLNRLAGITRINEATIEQLTRRLRQGEAWLRTLRSA